MRKLGSSLAAVLVASALILSGPSSPAAAQTLLCSGVSVKDVQKCDPGWAANMHFMHWNMYSGHNCTNYVAYRLKRDGVSQPSYRLGNADTWAPNAKKHGVRVDSKPEVGAVGAWPGRRHVVYVEEVGSNYLITSEDNYPGYYPKGMYRKIKVTKGEKAYPTQFIHFKGKSTINGPVPKVSGSPVVGSTLTASAGSWSPSDVTLKYQWLRDGVIISGATSKTYKLVSADAGHRITISVTGSKSGFSSRTASSEPTKTVTGPDEEEEPSSGGIQGTTPIVTGSAKRGRTLTGDAGDWGPSGVALAYERVRDDGVVVSTGSTTYKVRSADLGHTLRFKVTGSKKSMTSVSKSSAPTETVRATSTLVLTPEVSGKEVAIGVVVTVSNAPIPTGVVTVHEGSKRLKGNDLAAGRPGRATLRVTLAKGTHTLTVSYGGSDLALPSTATVTVKVK